MNFERELLRVQMLNQFSDVYDKSKAICKRTKKKRIRKKHEKIMIKQMILYGIWF